jgi:hypothetical protein
MTPASNTQNSTGILSWVMRGGTVVCSFALHLLFSQRLSALFVSGRLAHTSHGLLVKFAIWTVIAVLFLLWFNWKVIWKVLSQADRKTFLFVFPVTSLLPVVIGVLMAKNSLP